MGFCSVGANRDRVIGAALKRWIENLRDKVDLAEPFWIESGERDARSQISLQGGSDIHLWICCWCTGRGWAVEGRPLFCRDLLCLLLQGFRLSTGIVLWLLRGRVSGLYQQ